MKNIPLFLIFIFSIAPNTVLADVESWYTYWSIGLSSNDYPAELDAAIDAADSIPGVERTETSIDMLGFYWPINTTTIAGFVISGSADRLQDNYLDDYIQINQYLYGISAMKFFGAEIGDGFFLRGDIGISKMVLTSNFTTDEPSDNGTGVLLGAGFGVPVSNQSRILISVNFSGKTIDGENYKSTTLNIGGLW